MKMFKAFKTLCTDIDGELIQIKDAMNKLLQDYFISSKVVNLKIMAQIQVEQELFMKKERSKN